MATVRLIETRSLSEADRHAIRRLLDEAFEGDFSDDDWRHALGGWHALIEGPGLAAAHAAVVERELLVGARPFRSGYVEAVAVAPSLQRTGLGAAVMATVTDLVRARFDLGALSTGEWSFYARFGWERWRGPTYIRTPDGGLVRSAEEDDSVMIVRCPPSLDIDVAEAITCEKRQGDSW
jgi:aminoglycoside 2'-N-acetyltransferase I